MQRSSVSNIHDSRHSLTEVPFKICSMCWMELFEEVTDLVQGDKMVTISFILPDIRGLWEDMSAYNSYNGKLVYGLLNSTSKRLAAYEDNQVYQLATTLDPRFRGEWGTPLESVEITSTLKFALS